MELRSPLICEAPRSRRREDAALVTMSVAIRLQVWRACGSGPLRARREDCDSPPPTRLPAARRRQAVEGLSGQRRISCGWRGGVRLPPAGSRCRPLRRRPGAGHDLLPSALGGSPARRWSSVTTTIRSASAEVAVALQIARRRAESRCRPQRRRVPSEMAPSSREGRDPRRAHDHVVARPCRHHLLQERLGDDAPAGVRVADDQDVPRLKALPRRRRPSSLCGCRPS
jgi:hypothetical protein